MNLTAGYFGMMRDYLSPHSRALSCLKEQEESGVDYPPLQPFLIVGLEGSGHHLINRLSPEIAGDESGGRYSFPEGKVWRDKDEIPEYPKKVSEDLKHLILLRDPVDALTSALNRFWHYPKSNLDTLNHEINQLFYAFEMMENYVDQIPCRRRFYIPFEKLNADDLAAFLGVEPRDERLLTWSALVERQEDISCAWRWSNLGRKLLDFDPKSWPEEWFEKPCNLTTELTTHNGYVFRRLDESRPWHDMTYCAITTFRKRLTRIIYEENSEWIREVAPRKPMTYCTRPTREEARKIDQSRDTWLAHHATDFPAAAASSN